MSAINQRLATLVAMLSTASASTLAQTIDEIAELQKQKTVAELRGQIKSESPAPIPVEARPTVVRAQPPLAPPAVVSIFGLNPDALQAAISDGASQNIRIRVGDETPSGWTVERITRSAVTFTRPNRDLNARAKKDGPTSLRRVTVAWGVSQSTVIADQRAGTQPFAGPAAVPDVAGGRSYMVSPAGGLQPLPALQLVPNNPPRSNGQ